MTFVFVCKCNVLNCKTKEYLNYKSLRFRVEVIKNGNETIGRIDQKNSTRESWIDVGLCIRNVLLYVKILRRVI